MGSTDFILSAVRFQFRGAKLASVVVSAADWRMGFYGFNFVGSPLSVSRDETGENGGLREIGSTDFILPAVRFQFRGTKLARFVVLRQTEEIRD